jgi:hydrogenase maturation protease
MDSAKTIVVGLGNDLIADDGVGVLAARALKEELAGHADVVETSMHGLALLDIFLGYDRAILLDAIQTGKHPPGAVVEIQASEIGPIIAPSPHFAGLPEMLALAEQLQLEFPRQFRIFAVEVVDPRTLGGPMTPAVRDAIPALCARVREAVCSGGL